MPLLDSHSLGVDGADSLAVHAAAVGAAARAGNGLGGLGLPVCAARMSIRARGLVLVFYSSGFLCFSYYSLSDVIPCPIRRPMASSCETIVFS